MRTLTENQKEFLMNYFFKHENYPGWINIVTKLLETGKCIVPGTHCIWKGGIGNFIKTKEAENAVGCLLYEFDLEYFLTSEWYKQIYDVYISDLKDKKTELELKHQDLIKLKS